MGFHPEPPIKYDSDYFAMYQEYDHSEIADEINLARLRLFKGYAGVDHIDVGIGGGRFCRETKCFGYDVNPAARRWLNDVKKYRDPLKHNPESISLWDVLEHIPDPSDVLNCVTKRVLVSIPIFRDCEHVLKSKHYKPGEHVWYFTREGIIHFMSVFGFYCEMDDDREAQAGREDIHTFVFRRKGS